jgi:hypothetical protein
VLCLVITSSPSRVYAAPVAGTGAACARAVSGSTRTRDIPRPRWRATTKNSLPCGCHCNLRIGPSAIHNGDGPSALPGRSWTHCLASGATKSAESVALKKSRGNLSRLGRLATRQTWRRSAVAAGVAVVRVERVVEGVVVGCALGGRAASSGSSDMQPPPRRSSAIAAVTTTTRQRRCGLLPRSPITPRIVSRAVGSVIALQR